MDKTSEIGSLKKTVEASLTKVKGLLAERQKPDHVRDQDIARHMQTAVFEATSLVAAAERMRHEANTTEQSESKSKQWEHIYVIVRIPM